MTDSDPSSRPDDGDDARADGSGVRVPWRSRVVQVVLLSTFLAPLGVPLVSPALPVIRDAFGVSDAAAALVVSSYFVVGVVLSPFIGLLADRIGRKRVLVGGLTVFSLAGGAIVLAPDFSTVLAIRVIQGTAAAGIFVSTVTIVGDAFEGPRRNAVLGVNVAALSTGAAVFPVLGGALAGVAWNAPFLAYLLALPVALFAVVALPEPRRSARPGGLDYLRGALGSILSWRFGALYGVTFLAEFLFFGAVLTTVPFLLSASFSASALLVGLAITSVEATSIVVSAANGRLSTFLSNGWLIVVGLLAYGLGLVIAWLAPGPFVLGAGMLLVGVAVGLCLPSVDAAVTGSVSADYRAGALSLRNSTTFLGRAAGPVAFALAGPSLGYPILLLLAGVVAFVAGGVGAMALVRSSRGGESSSPR